MNAYNLLINHDNGVFKLITSNHPDMFIYTAIGYTVHKEGSLSACENAAYEYWDENDVPEEERILNP